MKKDEERKGRQMRHLFYISMIPLFIYLIMFFIFQLKNPKANEATFFTHGKHIIRLEKLDRFQ